MVDPLATYLRDHLAGAAIAIEMLEFLHSERMAMDAERVLEELRVGIEEDQEALRAITERVAGGPSRLKEVAAWVAEKWSRIKVSHATHGPFGTFEALELVSLGILGKRSLWRALQAVAPSDPRLRDVDYADLIARAESQYTRAEALRIAAAERALSSAPE